MITRRTVMASLGALLLGACNRICKSLALPAPAMGPAMIDAHCHLFNVTDLSATRFIRYVLLERYPDLARLLPVNKLLTPDDPSFLDRLIAVMLSVVGARSAPSAVTELALLDGRSPVLDKRRGEDGAVIPPDHLREATIDRMAALLGGARMNGDDEAEAAVRDAITIAGGGAPLTDAKATSLAERRLIARRALANGDKAADGVALAGGGFDIGGVFNFVGQLRRFRHCLVEELTNLHRNDGQNPLMLTPAMVDFGRWLADDPQRGSSFPDQVRLWRRISVRHSGPAIHGYVGFCPLRQVLHDLGRFEPGGPLADITCRDEPLAVVKDALENEGFLGVKLYPPMGFGASGNARRGESGPSFPKQVLKDVFGHSGGNPAETGKLVAKLGLLLDDALDRLYRLCGTGRVPIMAHGANSIAAYAESGAFADPYYWKPVFDRADAPPVMLAHFGGFADTTRSGSLPHDPGTSLAPAEEARFNASWEATLADYVQSHPDKPVFADVSMFTELFMEDRAYYLRFFRELDRRFPRMKERLVFGTDWVMLAQHGFAARYDTTVRAFLRDAFGDGGHVEAIMRLNLLRYAGLAEDSPTHRRITRIYGGDPVLHARLAAIYRPAQAG